MSDTNTADQVIIPTPRYRIGDTVWHASTQHATEQLPCPDCLGSRVWKVTTPAGTDMTTPCLRCAPHGYLRSGGGEDIPSLTVRKWTPYVARLTIGSVRIDTHDDRPVSYMCCETGVGSGSIYYEPDLFATPEEAETVAALLAVEQTNEIAAEPHQIAARKLGVLTVKLASDQADWNAVYQAWDVARWHREALEEIVDEKSTLSFRDVAEVRDYVNTRLGELLRYEFIDRHPFERLLVAARNSVDPTVCAAVAQIKDKLPSGDDKKVPADPEMV